MNYITLLGLAVLTAPQPRGEIGKRLDTPPTFTFQTARKPVDLELCIADILNDLSTPSVYSYGPEREVMIIGWGGGKISVAIELNGSANGTTVIGHVQPVGKLQSRMRDGMSGCV